ncbi:CDP-glucose 4,6-dehydratase [Paenibacillus mendelii]|nr:CDP-glucose 4,6-dehydratase [Paenibacillus mendelii]
MDMTNTLFWGNKKVFITGHTGFKGSWLSLWLQALGADVYGYSLAPEDGPNLFEQGRVADGMTSLFGNVVDADRLQAVMSDIQPDIVFHMAAQPLVRYSYSHPIETFQTNIMGTVCLLEAIRSTNSVKTVINITSDKCYDNSGSSRKDFVEEDSMGGLDPYSSSKGCAELITSAYRSSFYREAGIRLASARAGNVIGGGDWAADRILPDFIRAALARRPLVVRYPAAVRPWQHVLDCLNGYITLAEKMWESDSFEGGWNFGPDHQSLVTVEQMIDIAATAWPGETTVQYERSNQPYEANWLMLDSTQAAQRLNWNTRLSIQDTVQWTLEWYQQYAGNGDMKQVTLDQIQRYQQLKEL